MHSASAEAVLFNTRIFADLVDCLDHRNAAVRAKAEQMSDIGNCSYYGYCDLFLLLLASSA